MEDKDKTLEKLAETMKEKSANGETGTEKVEPMEEIPEVEATEENTESVEEPQGEAEPDGPAIAEKVAEPNSESMTMTYTEADRDWETVS